MNSTTRLAASPAWLFAMVVACGDGSDANGVGGNGRPMDDTNGSTDGTRSNARGSMSVEEQRPLTSPPRIIESPIDADISDAEPFLGLSIDERDLVCDWASTLRADEPLNLLEACTANGLERAQDRSECLLFRNGCLEITRLFDDSGFDEQIDREPTGCTRLTPPEGCTASVGTVKQCVREIALARYTAARMVSCDEPERWPVSFLGGPTCATIERVCLQNFGL